MNTSDFLEIIQNPAHLKNEQIFDLEDVLKNFPFFQPARVLYLKGLKNQNSFRYNQNLKTTAAHTTDRSVLFHFITSDTFFDSKAIKEETEIIEQIDDIDKRVILNINKEIVAVEEISTDKNRDENSSQEEAASLETVYIDETSLESLQKEIAEITHDEEVKLLHEKSEEDPKTPLHPAFKYSNSLKENDIPFELDADDTILFVDKNEPIEEDKDSPEIKDYDIRFEPIQEEISVDSEDEQLLATNVDISLDMDEPIHFDPDDRHSFSEWLQLSSLKPIDRSSETKAKHHQEKKMGLIDMFIEKKPKIKPSKIAGFTVNFDQVEEIESDVVMTETLARVYMDQKKYQSAIEAYKVLSLKFPEKSSFFADQIKKLENLK